MNKLNNLSKHSISINLEDVQLQGDLYLPESSSSLILFAHGSGSSRFSPRNQYVASLLQESNHGTLLLDLLSPKEEQKTVIGHFYHKLLLVKDLMNTKTGKEIALDRHNYLEQYLERFIYLINLQCK